MAVIMTICMTQAWLTTKARNTLTQDLGSTYVSVSSGLSKETTVDEYVEIISTNLQNPMADNFIICMDLDIPRYKEVISRIPSDLLEKVIGYLYYDTDNITSDDKPQLFNIDWVAAENK